MLTDLFPRERLTLAIAVFSIGSTIGAGCAFLFGGLIIAAVSQPIPLTFPLIGDFLSWQAVFFIVGIPGALISLLIFPVPDPFRHVRGAATHSRALDAPAL